MDLRERMKSLDLSQFDCEYVDVRIEQTHKTEISYQDFQLIGCNSNPSLGAFVRVFEKGGWYFLSTTNIAQLEKGISELVEKAKRGLIPARENNKPYNQQPAEHTLIKFADKDVSKVSVEEKLKLVESNFPALQRDDLKKVKAFYVDVYRLKLFKSSTGISFAYDFNQAGLRYAYSLVDGDKRFDDMVMYYGDCVSALEGKQQDLHEKIEKNLPFLHADTIEAGQYPVVMDNKVVGVFAHESFGHKSEADFMLGDEGAKEAWKIGSKVGSPNLTIVDYGAEAGTSGYCPIDDEGYPTQKTYLIKEGILQGRLHNQETARVFDEAPTGNGRAINFEFEPLVRMTNTYVEPGNKSFEELISKVDKGVYVSGYKHGSGLSTFTIAPQHCYMIRDGKLAEPVKVSVISGNVFETLDLIEDCSSEFELESGAFGGCGKMDQWPLSVGSGGAKVLISKMMVS